MNKYLILFLCLLGVTLIYFLAPILTPFLIGTLLAFLVNPIVNWLMRLKMPRIAAVIIVFLVLLIAMTLLIVLVVPLIQTQIGHLMDSVPDMVEWAQNTVIPLLQEHFGNNQLINISTIKTQVSQNWMKAGGAAGYVVELVLHSGFKLLHWLFDLLLIFVVTFYLLYDWKKVLDGLHSLLPKKYEPTIVSLVKQCNEVLGAFFRGQLLVMLTLGIYYSVGLTFIGLKVGIIIGVLVGFLSIIPYLGIVVGVTVASIAAFVQFGTFVGVVPVLLLFAVGQTLDGMFVTPKLVGNRIGLHPVAVIFAVLAGGVLFGFFGVLLALPVASIMMVLLRFFYSHYQRTQLIR